MQEVKHDGGNDHSVDYEKTDANLKVIVSVSIVGIILLIGSVILVDNIFELTKEKIVYDTALRPESTPLRELRAHEDEVLHSYKLVDPAKGIYQIPIDRAMEITANEAYRSGQTAP